MNLLQMTLQKAIIRKIGPAGPLFLEDQCKALNIRLGDIDEHHISALASQCERAAEPLIGKVNAKLLGGVISNIKSV